MQRRCPNAKPDCEENRDRDTQLEKQMEWMAPAPTGVALRHTAVVMDELLRKGATQF